MHRTTSQLEALLDGILDAPEDAGPIEMLVRRPEVDQRQSVETAEFTTDSGLVGDNWVRRLGRDGKPQFRAQLTLMNARVADAVAISRDRWPLAGDQVFVDMDLSTDNLPAGSRLKVGDAVIEVSEIPHTGCAKFARRFGKEALRFANIGIGKEQRFRGLNAFVVESGKASVGDKITKI